MDKETLIEEIEFEIMMCQKSGHAELIAGLERAIKIINEGQYVYLWCSNANGLTSVWSIQSIYFQSELSSARKFGGE